MKENEWIVSPQKLKENQKRAIEKEQEEYKKAKQKVINTIKIIVCAILIISLLLVASVSHKEAVKDCTEFGNSLEFCKSNL